jgi:uncharacterized membrane protein
MVKGLHAKLSVLTILLITTAGFAAASPADLTIFPKESSTRIDSFTSYEIEIRNEGPVKDRYSLSSRSSEVTIAPRDIELDSGQTETVNVWYNPETTKEEGTYSFTVTAESSATGDRYSVDGIVNVIKEHQVDVNVQDSQSVCLGEQATYEVQVTNNGIQKETFSLETDYGELSQDEVTLAKGETKTVTLTASSDSETTENFNVRAASTTSYAQSIQNVQFNAEVCYDSEVVFNPESQEVAAGTPAQFDVTVRNTGTRTDTFVLSTSTGELEQNEIEVPAGQNAQTTLTVTPENLGTQQVQVTADSQVQSTGSATMQVYNGNDVEVGFQGTPERVCESGTYEYSTLVENTGEASDTYSISASTGEASTSELQLDPGEAEEVLVTVNSSEYEEESSHNLTVTAQSQTFSEPTGTASQEFTVQNCWDVNMEIVPSVQSAGENRSVVYEINLDNPGAVENTYELSYEGPQWISIRPEQLTIGAGESDSAYIYAGIPFQKQGQVEITATAVGNEARESQTVQLVIGEDVEEAIRDDSGGGITGSFSRSVSGIVDSVTGSSNLIKVAGSIVLGLVITALILVREW